MRVLLVDDDAQVLRGVTRIMECESDGWAIESALSGIEALQILDSGGYNVLVSDMRMPGMDGAELLQQVQDRHPNVLRVVLSGEASRETVMRVIHPMHQYLSKPCDPGKLIDVIRKAEIYQETIHSTEVLDALGKANCLPSLSDIVIEIDSVLESKHCDSEMLGKLVLKDPTLSAKILQLANSAIFGLKQPVIDIEQAMSVVGVDMVRAIAMSSSLFKFSGSSVNTLPQQLFKHSIEVAGICRQLARWERADSVTSKTVFSGGLLHDVGKILLLNAFEEEYTQLMQSASKGAQSLIELETSKFAATHAGVGAYLLDMWGLPSSLVETVAAHHSPAICARSSLACQIVFGANWIASGADEAVLRSCQTENCDDFAAKLKSWNQKCVEERKGDLDE
ncbi:response regulator [Mariniblastus fucicola]|uniref:Hydrogenase transcriptional regulatory protein hupR1 n=1 Tax=Mariniblastus fucicola TaxID=980251 RepID=A0A5B9P2P3_9BACT|nr:response regulator [Mariniblastus fucicola]QEG20797.1 Hydrogenase transcriptional regulatory protein hupR1 [Mariniblastus fucicola]